MSKLLDYSCKSLAVVLHPLLVPTYIYTIMVCYTTGIMGNFNATQKATFIALIFVATFVLPMLVVVLQLMFTQDDFSFRSLFIENSKDRVRPFLLVSLVYCLLSYYVWTTWQSQLAMATILGAIALAIFITAFISRFWKISAHAVGIGGVSGNCLLFNFHYLQMSLFGVLLISILAAGVLLSSRIYLGAHTHAQVYAGWALGATICYCSIFFL